MATPKSEIICKKAGEKFFFRDHVFEDLNNIYNSAGKRIQLCDALFEYFNFYVVIQIKERMANTFELEKEKEWMSRVVYGEAFDQVNASLNYIKSIDIVINDCFRQKVVLCKNNVLIPVVLFVNQAITEYERVIQGVNVFALNDFLKILDVFIHPFELIGYLLFRAEKTHKNEIIQSLSISNYSQGVLLSNIKEEKELANHYHFILYDGDKSRMMAASKMSKIIRKYRSKIIGTKDVAYKNVINILSSITPFECVYFVDRYEQTLEDAKNNNFTFTKMLKKDINGKKIGITFLSSCSENLNDSNQYFLIMDSKKVQHKLDAILLIEFSVSLAGLYDVNWIYDDTPYRIDDQILMFYKEAGFYNGSITKDTLLFFANMIKNT